MKINQINTKLFLIKFLFATILIILLTHCSSTKNIGTITKTDSLVIKKYFKKNISIKNKVILKADVHLNKKFKTIIDKEILPPSGNKHDYISRAIYYWPEKTSHNKKWKYVDGKINKESLTKTDHNTYYKMLRGLQDLSLAYQISGDIKYAKKSVELIKEWFIDEETKMNPHFNYAQAIPGKNDGTPSGIIDARGILWVIDAVKIIGNSQFWNEELDDSFREWCSELLDWLQNSEFGERESAANNNHGTYYDLQIIKLATFLDKISVVDEMLPSIKTNRIEKQISLDGSLVEEMKRTNPHMYSIFNLSALIGIAEVANEYDIDLWNYKNENCGSIKDGVDFLVKNYRDDNRKIFKNKVSYKNLMRILPRANALSDSEYTEVINQIISQNPNTDLTHLYFSN